MLLLVLCSFFFSPRGPYISFTCVDIQLVLLCVHPPISPLFSASIGWVHTRRHKDEIQERERITARGGTGIMMRIRVFGAARSSNPLLLLLHTTQDKHEHTTPPHLFPIVHAARSSALHLAPTPLVTSTPRARFESLYGPQQRIPPLPSARRGRSLSSQPPSLLSLSMKQHLHLVFSHTRPPFSLFPSSSTPHTHIYTHPHLLPTLLNSFAPLSIIPASKQAILPCHPWPPGASLSLRPSSVSPW